jgi:hypothetical protein
MPWRTRQTTRVELQWRTQAMADDRGGAPVEDRPWQTTGVELQWRKGRGIVWWFT